MLRQNLTLYDETMYALSVRKQHCFHYVMTKISALFSNNDVWSM